MLTLTCKLSELNDDGLWLAHRLHILDDRAAPAVRGDTVSFDKRHGLVLRSKLTVWERAERFDSDGRVRFEPMSDAEHEKWRRHVEVYGNDDATLYTFNPVRHLYAYGRNCVHCVREQMAVPGGGPTYKNGHIVRSCSHPSHPERLDALRPNPAAQINELGRFARWWCEFGEFEPTGPRQPDRRTERVIDALFGSRPFRARVHD